MSFRWEKEEIAMLNAFYSCSHADALYRLFAGKYTKKQISDRAHKYASCKKSQFYCKYWDTARRRSHLGRSRIATRGHMEVLIEGKWMRMSHIVWQQANGPIPSTHTIIHKDGNKKNIELGNLMLRARKEQLKIVSFHNYPLPVQQAIRTNNKILRAINEQQQHH